jgi:hypothetical protein
MSILSNQSQCTKIGDCKRNDNQELIPNYQSFTNPLLTSTYTEIIYEKKKIISIENYDDILKPDYIKDTKMNYTCADGFSECMFTCCEYGRCNTAKNICGRYIDDRNRIIFIGLIVFSLLLIIYWGVFVYIGVKYSKSKRIVRNSKQAELNIIDIRNIQGNRKEVNKESSLKGGLKESSEEVNGRVFQNVNFKNENEKGDFFTSQREFYSKPVVQGNVQILK